jgi:hypothetical protein
MSRRGLGAAFALIVLSVAACATKTPAPHPAADLSCHFNPETLTFEVGDARAQARCLLRHVNKGGALGPERPLPPTLGRLVGTDAVPSVAALRAYILGRPWAKDQAAVWAVVAANLDKPVSRAWDNRPDAPQARYFVIHDTSEPYLETAPFPTDLDHDPGINDLSIYFQPGKDPVAHFFTNRRGELAQGHDFATPWRATKREHFPDLRAKGLFLHIENGQPRRQDPGLPRNDTIAPQPGFGEAQYDTLALLYVVASVRAHRWLIPGFHSAVDEGIAAKHDDPQNFDLRKFDAAVARLLAAVPH